MNFRDNILDLLKSAGKPYLRLRIRNSKYGQTAFIYFGQPMSYFGANWSFSSNLEIRPKQMYHNINPACINPRRRLIPELKRSGFNGNFYKFSPFDIFHVLLTTTQAETLLKAGQTELFKYFTTRDFQHIDDYWASIKICIRNGYQIKDASIWCDYINLLHFFEKDLHNVKYVCPADLKAEHDRYVKKKRDWQNRERMKENRKKALEKEARFKEMKSRFFGIQFTDGLIEVHMLESVLDIMQEGDLMHHCVFTNEYHLKPNSLILSACINGQKVETVEFSLSKMQVVQSRGMSNKTTEYHDRIIKLVNENKNLIKKRLAA